MKDEDGAFRSWKGSGQVPEIYELPGLSVGYRGTTARGLPLEGLCLLLMSLSRSEPKSNWPQIETQKFEGFLSVSFQDGNPKETDHYLCHMCSSSHQSPAWTTLLSRMGSVHSPHEGLEQNRTEDPALFIVRATRPKGVWTCHTLMRRAPEIGPD